MPYIEYPECGKIINTHGCHGALKIESWCDSPTVLAALPFVYLKKGEMLQPLRVLRASVFRNFVFAELEGVDSMEAADAMRNTVLYARRADLHIPEGTLLIAEMIGLPVIHAETGERLGTLKDVIHPAMTDIYVIATEKGEAMVPVVEEFVRSVDIEKGICLAPIEGMF
ncbi:MAG: 16S rRNA processing protein RimM [Ruminococcaceae bacterium]|nr:16S rRNA processing protein RimM [Oscillospiraceae bacterium]